MNTLKRLFNKKKKLVIGLMSGTSADGIDAVVVEIIGSGIHTKIRQLAFRTYSYPKGFKQFLLINSDTKTTRLDEVVRLDILIAHFFADAVRKIVRELGMEIGEIDLISSHGQTIHHLPKPRNMFGKNIRSTMQIGNPSVISKLTGVVTIGNFRVGDIAVGGSGAPIVPLFDFLLLRSEEKNRIALNIGGISNITVLKKNCLLDDIIAFDTGPGNMIIDSLTQKFYNKPFDNNGRIACKGKIIIPLLRWLISHPYFKLKPPKSTGREMFGEDFINKLLQKCKIEKKEDIITTVSEFTAMSIYKSYLQFVPNKMNVNELLVSGGGVHNIYIMNALKRYFCKAQVLTTDELNISSDAKEAICFALLANETISGNTGNVPKATGAKKPTVLGVICLP